MGTMAGGLPVRRGAYLLATVATFAILPASSHGQSRTLRATVGPGHTISLRTATGGGIRTLQPGTYTIVVRDRSATHNFHLLGSGVNKKTGVTFSGSVTWKVTLKLGKVYRYRCDPHASTLKGTLRVARGGASPAPPPPPPPTTTTTYDPYP
jgi:hypothetical protein